MVKQQKNNTRKKRFSNGLKANRTKAGKIDASTFWLFHYTKLMT